MYIRKFFILVFIVLLLPVCAVAQSTMTDEQVLEFVVEENSSGTSQSQIVTKLMQRALTYRRFGVSGRNMSVWPITKAWAQ